MKNGREFWSGKEWNEISLGFRGEGFSGLSEDFNIARKWDVEYEMDIPFTKQKGLYDCTHACKLSVDKYYGSTDQSAINSKWLKYVNSNNGLKNTLVPGYYQGAGYSTNLFGNGFYGNYNAENALPWILNEMKSNSVVQLGWKPHGVSAGHASLVKKIQYLSDFSKYRIHIMDPAGHASKLRSLSRVYQILSINR